MTEIKVSNISNVDWDYIKHQTNSSLYSFESLSVYENLDILIITNQQQLLAIWPIPFIWKNGKKIAQRQIRLLPYHPPLLFKKHVLDKRRLISVLIEHMQEHYHAIDLPLSPGFDDLSLFSTTGFHVEWRNTHMFTLAHSLHDHVHVKAKNHIRFAQKKVIVKSSKNADKFDFNLGIVVNKESYRMARKQLASNLMNSGNGIIFTALADENVVGQALVVNDRQTAYLFHTWFKKNTIRGIASLLISMAYDWAFTNKQLQSFDLEGSIIPSIDHFFASLGGLQAPYAYIQWCRDQQEMLNMIRETLFMPLRLQDKIKK